MPLAWVLGAMLGIAAASLLSGHTLKQPGSWRRIAQGCIGLAIGLAFTPDTLSHLLALLPCIALACATALVLSVLTAPLIQRLAGMDGPTAIYSVALGASAEMALQALRAGADAASVASAHAVRIIIVTSSATLLAWFLGHSQGGPVAGIANAVITMMPVAALAFLMPCAAVAALAMQRLDLPNPWLLGPLLVGGIGAAITGGGRLPEGVLIASQLMIGWALGQNMTRSFFGRAPRILISAALITVGILAVCLGMGALISRGAGLPLMTAFLALAPGGMAEMGVIAKAFSLGAPVVAAFHIARVVCTIFLTGALARWMLRTGWVKP